MRSTLGFRVAASAIVLVVVLGLAEGIARIVGPEVPAWRALDKPGTLLVGHDTRLWGVAPGVAGNGEGQATVDAIGLRSPIPETPRPQGRERILVVGDSSIFGHGVPDDQTLSAHLQDLLQARGLDVDTANGGIPGYSTEQTRALLDEVGWGLEPTLLVIANLWSDNNFDLWMDRDLLHTARTFHQNPLRSSAAYTLLASSLDRMKGGSGARVITWTQTSGPPSGEVQRRVPLQDYAANLDLLARQARERGVGVAYLCLANRDLVKETFDEGSWDAYIQAQAQVAAHHGAVRVEAVYPLQRAHASGLSMDELFVDELHPSGAAHRLIADELAAALVAAGWPQDPQLGTDAVFDAAHLSDAWHTQVEGPDSRGSPQQQLISDAEVPPTAGTPGDRSQGEHAAATEAPSTPDWWVEGTVQGAGAITVEVHADGRVVASSRLRQAGPFRLQVGGEHDDVEVVATDADGNTADADAEPGAATVELDLR